MNVSEGRGEVEMWGGTWVRGGVDAGKSDLGGGGGVVFILNVLVVAIFKRDKRGAAGGARGKEEHSQRRDGRALR